MTDKTDKNKERQRIYHGGGLTTVRNNVQSVEQVHAHGSGAAKVGAVCWIRT